MSAAVPARRTSITATRRPVVLDTDPGIDDALALLLALRSPEIQVELITTVAGNVPVPMATANAQRVLGMLALSVSPILAQGASRPFRRPLHTATAFHGADGLGGVSTLRQQDGSLRYPLPEQPVVQRQAVQRLVQAVQQYGQDLTVIALGPLTNIARALQRAPETMRQLGHLVIMGGAIGVPGNISPVAEFNIFVDPHAADVVLQAGLPTTLVPLDVTRQVRLTRDWFPRAGTAPPRLLQALADLTRYPLQQQVEGMVLHDPLAVAVAIDSSLVSCTSLPVAVETRGQHTLGMTVADRRATVAGAGDIPRLEVALEVETSRVLEFLATRLLA